MTIESQAAEGAASGSRCLNLDLKPNLNLNLKPFLVLGLILILILFKMARSLTLMCLPALSCFPSGMPLGVEGDSSGVARFKGRCVTIINPVHLISETGKQTNKRMATQWSAGDTGPKRNTLDWVAPFSSRLASLSPSLPLFGSV